MRDAALQAGNSEAIIRKHYYAVKSPEEVGDFFEIVPKKMEEAVAVEEKSEKIAENVVALEVAA